ncbi:hypothetical protein AC579_6846 [Pseudocercospora musae]|uniref:Uncharacterized protein n=1 Tax=Pseudocercospora musae TaxID=113226 RepID=A0A139I7S2_9PEZI|nr:hypothetical protein AC579_6846 [Pseudocercospora musae]
MGIVWHDSSYANAKEIFGVPNTDTDHASPATLARYGSDDIYSPSPSKALHGDQAARTYRPNKLGGEAVTSTALLNARQQEPITDACTAPSTIYVGQASCLPFVADTTGWVCVTSTSTSVGCNIGGDTISTTSVSTTSVAARCAQTGCGACLPLIDTPPVPVTVDCKNCSTTGGLVFAAPITTLPPDVNSGQATATGSTTQSAMSGPSSTAPAALGGRDVGVEVAPAAESKLGDLVGAIRDFSRSFGRYVDNLNMVKLRAPPVTDYEGLSSSAVTSIPTLNPEKRSLLQPQDYPGGHDGFMVAEVEQAANVDMLVYHRPPGTGGRSSAKVKGFRTDGFNLAIDKLNACTSVIVVARKGCYISHIWEVPTMMDEQLFQEDVLFGLFEGDDSGYLPGISDHSHDASLFNTLKFGQTENVIQPIIVTPWIDPGVWGDESRPWRFMHEIQRTKDQLQEMFRVEPIVQTYKLLEGDDDATVKHKLETTARGKVVIQYDPRQYLPTEEVTDSQGQQHSCVKQYAALRVYADVNQEPIYEDTWLAMPEQAAEWDPEDSGQRNPQPLKLHKLRIRDESQQIVIYGCVKLDPGDSSGCRACTSEGACTLDPNEDQGQDGAPPTSALTCPACTSPLCGLDPDDDQGENGSPPTSGLSCTACTSGTCGLDPNDPQGEEGTPPSIGNGTSSGWNTTTSSITRAPCSLVTPTTAVVNGTSYTGGSACRCGNSRGPVRTTTGSDSKMTYFCSNGPTTIPVSTANSTSSRPTTTSQSCSVITQAGGVINNVWVPSSEACVCGSMTKDLVTQLGWNGSETVLCGNGTNAVAIGTTTQSATAGLSGCSISRQPAKTITSLGVVTLPAQENCNCAGGQQAPATTWKDDNSWYIGCVYSSTAVTVTTAPGPFITSCDLSSASSNASMSITDEGWMCNCNDGQTTSAIASSVNEGMAYACPTSQYPQPVTTVPAPTLAITGCTLDLVPAITIAQSSQGTTTYYDHYTCGCNNGFDHVGVTTSWIALGLTAMGCNTTGTGFTYQSTITETPSSCSVASVTQASYCACADSRVGALVTTTDPSYCSFDGYTSGETTIPGPTATLPPAPEVTAQTCRMHVRQSLLTTNDEVQDPNVSVVLSLYDGNDLPIYDSGTKNWTFWGHVESYPGTDKYHWPLEHNITLDVGVPKSVLSDASGFGLDRRDNAVYDAGKNMTYGFMRWNSLMTKANVPPDFAYCSMGGWAKPEDGESFELGSHTQDFDCWFQGKITNAGGPVTTTTVAPPEPTITMTANKCQIHVEELTRNIDNQNGDAPVKVNFTVYDQTGAFIWSAEHETHFKHAPWGYGTSQSARRWLGHDMTIDYGVGEGEESKDDRAKYVGYDKTITYGELKWNATTERLLKNPYCDVGDWDIPAKIPDDSDSWSNRQKFDCWFPCLVSGFGSDEAPATVTTEVPAITAAVIGGTTTVSYTTQGCLLRWCGQQPGSKTGLLGEEIPGSPMTPTRQSS